jgi:hypothetical protein
MEDEDGNSLGEVLDPGDLTGRIVALAGHRNTVCLRFVDPYGNAVFNQLQIPALIRELEAARVYVTQERLASLGESELKNAQEAKWDATIVHALRVRKERMSADQVREHLERLLELVRRARGRVHTYLKFYGE